MYWLAVFQTETADFINLEMDLVQKTGGGDHRLLIHLLWPRQSPMLGTLWRDHFSMHSWVWIDVSLGNPIFCNGII